MFDNRSYLWGMAIIAVLLSLVTASCSQPTAPPPTPDVRLECNPPDGSELQAGDTATLAIEGSGNLTFHWTAVRGTVSSQNVPAIIYTAPYTPPGADVVSVGIKGDGYEQNLSCNYIVLVPPTPTLTPTLPPPPLVFQKGIALPAWWRTHYCESEFGLAAIRDIARLGATWVQLVPTWYQDDRNSNVIKPVEDKTPSDDCLIRAIRAAHNAGLKVMLKPHVDSLDGYSRGELAPADPAAWMESYQEMVLHYVGIARENSVEIFVVGTELKSLSEHAHTEQWRALISQIRQQYFGRLTYAANWDDYDQIEFWEDLDYVGIDAYFPLSNQDDLSREEIQDGWQSYNNHRWAEEIEAFAAAVDRPVLFTEIGYASQDGAAQQPFSQDTSSQSNLELQGRLYEVALRTFWAEPYFKGFYWWFWDLEPDPEYAETGFMPKDPALAELARWYELDPPDMPSPVETAVPTPVLTPTLTPTIGPTITLTPSQTPEPISGWCDVDTSRFGMCPGTVTWQPEQNDPGTRAIVSVESSVNERAYLGLYSARFHVDLQGGSSTNAKGEAFIDMRYSIPRGYTDPAPYDFSGQTVKCKVWVAPEAWGDPAAPNGVRLYLKDESFDSEYSIWLNLGEDAPRDGNWFHIALPVGGGERFGGLDPTHILLLGVQFAANTGYTGSYQGSIYVDACNW